MKNFLLTLILVFGFTCSVISQNRISGKVFAAETQEPLGGVIVMVEGTNIGTLTDVYGNYQFEVPQKKATISFKAMGRETVEKSINGSGEVNANMKISNNNDEPIQKLIINSKAYGNIVIELNTNTIKYNEDYKGYSGKGDVRIYGTVNKDNMIFVDGERLKLNEKMDKTYHDAKFSTTAIFTNNNKKQMLINITTDKAQQKSGLLKFKAKKEPLVVIDGKVTKRSKLNEISPDTISSISFIKAKSAAKIYGKDAEGGVMIITTKKKK